MKISSLSKQRGSGFTLVEVLVSTALIALLMTLLLSTVDQTNKVWGRATSKVSQFQGSRVAFEQITRNLSQATLNTYYQLDPPRSAVPTDFIRASDLHFVSGPTPLYISGTAQIHPTHSVFFHVPLGATEKTASGSTVPLYGKLDTLLTPVGYYVEWSDVSGQPNFLPPTKRWRFRLMEARQPAEQMAIYPMNAANVDTPGKFKTTDWIKALSGATVSGYKPTGTGETQAKPRVMAENIIALVIVPKTGPGDRTFVKGAEKIDLAPSLVFDSRPADGAGKALAWSAVSGDKVKRQWYNQLPPVMQVTLVAIDENSAQRFAGDGLVDPTVPEWTKGLFPSSSTVSTTDDLKADFATLEKRLVDANVNYRIFTADVVIRGAKFSKPDKN